MSSHISNCTTKGSGCTRALTTSQQGSGQSDVQRDVRCDVLCLDILESFGDNEKLCARYSVDARHTGRLVGIEPTGRQFSIVGITVMHFEDGRVVEPWDVDNSAEVFAELRGQAS